VKLTAYCMDWHLKASDSSLKIFVEPLAPELEIEQRAWDGTTVPDPLPADRPTVFYMLPPPADFTGDAVWVPMWDQARGFDQAWWDAVPDQVRVVALSDEVERRARAAGLTTLRLQYFLDPATVAPVASGEPPVVFYWNRTGLLGPRALGRVCHDVGARELIFRPTLDPGYP
jgi:hypothetical protein